MRIFQGQCFWVAGLALAVSVFTSGEGFAQGRCGGGGGGMMPGSGGRPPGGMGMMAGSGQGGGSNFMQTMQAAQQMQTLQAQRVQAFQLQQLRMREQMQASLLQPQTQRTTQGFSANLPMNSAAIGPDTTASVMRRRLPGYGQPTAKELREERRERRRAERLANRNQ